MAIPKHIAFISGGNRRWAKAHSLDIAVGHKKGEKAICDIVAKAKELGVKYVSFFVWSNENDKKRSVEEKQNIANLIEFFVEHEILKLKDIGAKLRILGDKPSFVTNQLFKFVDRLVSETKDNTGIDVCFYFGYNSRTEIVKAVKSCAADVQQGRLNIEDINEDFVRSKFYAPDVPDPDILIRTSGEIRLSNFLLWQLAFTELFFVDKYWPDFTGDDLAEIIKQFENRERRYGM